MLAHAVNGIISSRDVDNVFDMVRAKCAERDSVLRALPESGVRVGTDRPEPFPETDDVADLETAATRDLVRPATRTALEEDVETARRVLRSDYTRKNPSNRMLTAQEEVGLAALIRGPEGYAKPRLLLASESLSGIVQKAGDTPHQVIGNGFSER